MSFTRFYNFLFYCSVCSPDQAGSSGKKMSAVPTNALDDVKVLNTTNPLSLTSSFTIFEKADLIQRHRSRFSGQ